MDFMDFVQANWAVLTSAFIGAFVIDYFANILSFENRFVSAVVTGLLLIVVIWGTLILIGDDVVMQPLLMAGVLMFLVALLGNILTFGNRFMNALVTAIIFIIPFALGLHYILGSYVGSVTY